MPRPKSRPKRIVDAALTALLASCEGGDDRSGSARDTPSDVVERNCAPYERCSSRISPLSIHCRQCQHLRYTLSRLVAAITPHRLFRIWSAQVKMVSNVGIQKCHGRTVVDDGKGFDVPWAHVVAFTAAEHGRRERIRATMSLLCCLTFATRRRCYTSLLAIDGVVRCKNRRRRRQPICRGGCCDDCCDWHSLLGRLLMCDCCLDCS